MNNLLNLRPYQEAAVNKFVEFIKTDTQKNPLIVMPTGSGKSVVLAFMLKKYLELKPNSNIVVATHSRELIKQDYDKTIKIFKENYDKNFENLIGLYAASFNRKEIKQITFLQIQSSVNKNLLNFKNADLIIIDEAHRVSPTNKNKSLYQNLFNKLKENNSNLKIIGLTATPFRLMGKGQNINLIELENNIFDTILYEISTNDLIKQGYLSNFEVKNFTTEEIKEKLKKIRIKRDGDFDKTQLSQVMSQNELLLIISNILKELLDKKERHHILGFCVSVTHAQFCCNIFRENGLECDYIDADLSKNEREQKLENFKNGKIKILLNVEILTTGYDAPYIDTILIMRPTKSSSLHYQILGRGFRKDESKKNTLYLDFTENIAKFKFSWEDKFFVQCPKCNSCFFQKVDVCDKCNYNFYQNCNNCGTKNSVENEICEKCGKHLYKKCPNCKTNNFINDSKCQNCNFEFLIKCPDCNFLNEYYAIKCKNINCGKKLKKLCPKCKSYIDINLEHCQCNFNFNAQCPRCGELNYVGNEYCHTCQTKLRICLNCNHLNYFFERTCQKCEEPLFEVNLNSGFIDCPICGEKISSKTKVCNHCKNVFTDLTISYASKFDFIKNKIDDIKNNIGLYIPIIDEINKLNINNQNLSYEYVSSISCQKIRNNSGKIAIKLIYHTLNNQNLINEYLSYINIGDTRSDFFTKIWFEFRYNSVVVNKMMEKLKTLRKDFDEDVAADIAIDGLFDTIKENKMIAPKYIAISKKPKNSRFPIEKEFCPIPFDNKNQNIYVLI